MRHGNQTHGLRHNDMMLVHQFGRELVNTVLPDKRGMEIKATYVAQESLLAIGFLDLRVSLGTGFFGSRFTSRRRWPCLRLARRWARFFWFSDRPQPHSPHWHQRPPDPLGHRVCEHKGLLWPVNHRPNKQRSLFVVD